MGTLLILVGVIYAVALMVQMLFYTQSVRKTAQVVAEDGFDTNRAVADAHY